MYYRIEINNRNNECINVERTDTMKSAIQYALIGFFNAEVCRENSTMEARIFKIDDASVPFTITECGLVTFEGYQRDDGTIRYYTIITDQHNINHDYRGNYYES